MRQIAFIASAAVLIGLACASEPARSVDDDDGDSSGPNSSSNTTGSGGDTSSGAGASTSSGNGGSGAGQPTIPYCRQTCVTAADCVQTGAAFDEDNYSCDAGYCTYNGCNNDAECQTQGNLVCRASFDPLMLGGAMTCVFACSTAADCDFGGGPAFDANNYTCENGGCIYTGCNDETECQGQPGNLTCRDTGAGVAYCQTACTTPSDCDFGGGSAYDADNYACDAGVCVYAGCNSTAECASLGAFECVE